MNNMKFVSCSFSLVFCCYSEILIISMPITFWKYCPCDLNHVLTKNYHCLSVVQIFVKNGWIFSCYFSLASCCNYMRESKNLYAYHLLWIFIKPYVCHASFFPAVIITELLNIRKISFWSLKNFREFWTVMLLFFSFCFLLKLYLSFFKILDSTYRFKKLFYQPEACFIL